MDAERSRTRDFDWWLLLLTLAICAIGFVQIYSATQEGNLRGMHWRHLLWVALGLTCMIVVSRIDYHAILEQAPILYVIGLAALVAVLAVGERKFGHKSWIQVGGLTLQVSELVKLIIIIVLARFFSEVRSDRLSLLDLAKAGVLTVLPIGLILMQPDAGTAMMTVPVLVMGAFLAGLQWRHAAGALLLAALLVPASWMILKPYQKERIQTYFEPDNRPQSAGYQSRQARIAVGSGGIWGKGIGKGSQNQLGYLPVRWSDFIFAAMAEELGFAGVFAALVLYMVLLLRLVENAQRAYDRAGMYLVMGVAAVLGIHVLWNVAMVIGYLPVTGIPLPLMSYGGSATLFVFLGLGLVMNVRMRRFVN